MRKLLPYLGLITILLVGAGAFAMPQIASAADFNPFSIEFWIGGVDVLYGFIGKILWWAAVPLTGWVVWLIGNMIDLIIGLSSDASFYNSDAIRNSWSILRDVANMTFIFILIFNGLQVILNRGNLASIKKVLGGVILAAVFINFSLFFTKAVIDVSNITAAWFIQGIYGIGGTTSISDAIHGTFQMSKLAASPIARGGDFSAQTFATGVAALVLNCVAIYVFFQLFFILLGRLVTFMLLLITAPIGFVGFLLPPLAGYGKKWWDELTGQAMLAPMLFLMIYIVLYIVDQTSTFMFNGGGVETDSFTGSSFSVANYMMFAIIIALLLKVLDVAKQYSGEMGGKIGGILKAGVGIALGGATAGTGLFLRQTAGRAMFNMTQNKDTMGALQAGASKSLYGRIKLAAVNKAATSSFDARATTLGGKALGSLGTKIAGIPVDAGKVGKTEAGGFKAGAEAFAKKEKEWAEKNLGKGPSGEVNRMRYSESMRQGNLLTNLNKLSNVGVGAKAYTSAYEDIEGLARDNYRKKGVEDAKKATKEISNKIVDERMAIYQLETAIKTNSENEINAALEAEKARINKIAKEMEKGAEEKNKVAYLEHRINTTRQKAEEPGAASTPEGQAANEQLTQLTNELAELQKTMTKEEREKATKDGKRITDYVKYQTVQNENIDAALKASELVAKKDAAKKITSVIKEERIGIEKKDPKTGEILKDEKGKPIKTGLSEELEKKKEELKKEQAELDAIEGKQKKDNKGGDKKPDAPEKPAEEK